VIDYDKKLGEGGFAKVYECYEKENRENIWAIKIV
jgi:hypothetical protein